MKKLEEQSVDLKKEELIRILSESLNKNCKTAEDVTHVIKCMDEYACFMDKQKQHRHDIILDIREIKEFIREESGSRKMLKHLNIVCEEFIGGMMIADRYQKENELLLEIVNDPALVI